MPLQRSGIRDVPATSHTHLPSRPPLRLQHRAHCTFPKLCHATVRVLLLLMWWLQMRPLGVAFVCVRWLSHTVGDNASLRASAAYGRQMDITLEQFKQSLGTSAHTWVR